MGWTSSIMVISLAGIVRRTPALDELLDSGGSRLMPLPGLLI